MVQKRNSLGRFEKTEKVFCDEILTSFDRKNWVKKYVLDSIDFSNI